MPEARIEQLMATTAYGLLVIEKRKPGQAALRVH